MFLYNQFLEISFVSLNEECFPVFCMPCNFFLKVGCLKKSRLSQSVRTGSMQGEIFTNQPSVKAQILQNLKVFRDFPGPLYVLLFQLPSPLI